MDGVPQRAIRPRPALPAEIFALRRSSDSGDGDLFETPDREGRLLVGAIENSEGFTPRSYQAFIAKRSYPGLRIDYAPVGQSWAFLSATMVYEKIMFGCGSSVINSFAMIYPIAARGFYDDLVEAIETRSHPGTRAVTGRRRDTDPAGDFLLDARLKPSPNGTSWEHSPGFSVRYLRGDPLRRTP